MCCLAESLREKKKGENFFFLLSLWLDLFRNGMKLISKLWIPILDISAQPK